MLFLESLLPREIADKFSLAEKYRANQIFLAVAQGKTSLEKINIPKDLRESISQKCAFPAVTILQKQTGSDGTVKFQFGLFDGAAVESVVLTDADGRKTICLSSQVGCAMGCAFCQTGRLGFSRNLDAGEIVAQFFSAERECGKLDNAVFMGMGEPLANLENVKKAIEILADGKGRNFSKSRVTVSTSGLADKILELAESGLRVKLAVSLTTADEVLRKDLMPAASKFSLFELKNAVAEYSRKTETRVTLECALLSNKNSSVMDARKIINFAKGLNAHINLIPWNEVKGLPFKTPSRAEIALFQSELEKARLPVTVRFQRGNDVCGACGQLGKLAKGKKDEN